MYQHIKRWRSVPLDAERVPAFAFSIHSCGDNPYNARLALVE